MKRRDGFPTTGCSGHKKAKPPGPLVLLMMLPYCDDFYV